MSILKALQKKQSEEQPQESEELCRKSCRLKEAADAT